MPTIITVVAAVVAFAVSGVIFYFVGYNSRKKAAEAKIGSAETEAKRIVNDAIKTAEQKRKEAIIEAKDEAFKLKAEADKEIKERRAEVARQEKKSALAGLTQLFSERIAPQIVVKRLEAEDLTLTVAFEIKLTLIYGVRIPDVVEKVRCAIKREVEELTGYKVDRIDILVEKLVRADLPPELPTPER